MLLLPPTVRPSLTPVPPSLLCTAHNPSSSASPRLPLPQLLLVLHGATWPGELHRIQPLLFRLSLSLHSPPVLHGGPGAGCWPNHARFFDPAAYRIVLCDQRGAGKSTPAGCVVENRTDLLVGDLEAVREHLKVDRWAVVLGGSWGTTLALAYAQAHPGRVAGMVLRGVCLLRRREIDWFYRPGGAEALFPFAWRDLMAALPSPAPTRTDGDGNGVGSGDGSGGGSGGGNGVTSGSVVAVFYERLMSTDSAARDSALTSLSVSSHVPAYLPSPSHVRTSLPTSPPGARLDARGDDSQPLPQPLPSPPPHQARAWMRPGATPPIPPCFSSFPPGATPPSLLPPIPFPASPHPLPFFPPSPSQLPPIPFPASPHPLSCFPPSPGTRTLTLLSSRTLSLRPLPLALSFPPPSAQLSPALPMPAFPSLPCAFLPHPFSTLPFLFMPSPSPSLLTFHPLVPMHRGEGRVIYQFAINSPNFPPIPPPLPLIPPSAPCHSPPPCSLSFPPLLPLIPPSAPSHFPLCSLSSPPPPPVPSHSPLRSLSFPPLLPLIPPSAPYHPPPPVPSHSPLCSLSFPPPCSLSFPPLLPLIPPSAPSHSPLCSLLSPPPLPINYSSAFPSIPLLHQVNTEPPLL
ncbi:unnamed protein product [Closterium sp. Naga37s-1]|nr:unnamed protein product [Closterium sp. Naga37s-1]